jgi:hypothetical protein
MSAGDVARSLPITGDVMSGVDAVQSARQGDWTGAGLNALGLLPFIPAMGSIRLPSTRDGFDILAYKGMYSKTKDGELITRFDLPNERLWQTRHIEGARPNGGWFTDSQEVANGFASRMLGDGRAVYPVHLNMRGASEVDLRGAPARSAQWEKYALEADRVKELEAFLQAYRTNPRGVILRNTADEGNVFIPGSGRQIRSVYDWGR